MIPKRGFQALLSELYVTHKFFLNALFFSFMYNNIVLSVKLVLTKLNHYYLQHLHADKENNSIHADSFSLQSKDMED